MNGERIDCLLIGNNQMVFSEYVDNIKKMGVGSGAYRDLNLSFIESDGKACSLSDVYNRQFPDNVHGLLNYNNIFSATIGYLGTFLNRKGLSFDFINSFQEEKEYLADMLLQRRVMAIAITTTYYVSVLPILEIMDFIKSRDTQVKIILGGPFIANQIRSLDQPSTLYLLKQIGADFYINSSQGELALTKLLYAIKNNTSLNSIDNLIYREADSYIFNKISREENDLENNLVDWKLFKDMGRRMVSVRTAISCPFACAFCGFPHNAGEYTYIAPEYLCRELDLIALQPHINSVNFVDDTFNVPVNRFKEILKLFINKKYKFRWNSHFRCQYADEETVLLMKEAGCEGVFLGIESGSQSILENMNKKTSIEAYYRGMELLKKYGIISYASFIVGFPGETDKTVKDTIDFIETAQPDFYRTQLWYYDLMTPVHELKDKYKLRNSQFEWTHCTMNAKEAADWIDYIFINVRNSIWLPQNDFDYPGLFNLLSRGWSISEVKAYITSFNQQVSQKFEGSYKISRSIEGNGIKDDSLTGGLPELDAEFDF